MKKWPKHLQQAYQYAKEVKSGKILASKYHKLSIERFFRDLKDKRFTFDTVRADKAISIIELFKHIKGPLAGKNLLLEPWQKFILANIYGFKWKDTGLRRFSEAVIFIPRKNGKTTMAAPIACLEAFGMGEMGAEGYTCAVNRDQASICLNLARSMVNKAPDIKEFLGLEVFAKSIYQASTESFLQAVSSEAKSLDGKNGKVIIVDEYHSHKSDDVYDSMKNSTAARLEPLTFVISTAGIYVKGPFYQMVKDLKKVLLEQYKDESTFFIPFELDEEDDYRDPKVWPKANPNFGISVTEKYLEGVVKLAERSAHKKSNILTKHFNIFTQVGKQYFNMLEWKKGKIEKAPENLDTLKLYMGMDLASKVDLSALVGVFIVESEDESIKYYVQALGYLPYETIHDNDNKAYQDWFEEGHLRSCYGKTIDFDMIKDDAMTFSKEHNLQEIAFDPWNAQHLASQIEKEIGNEEILVEYRQTVQNYSEVMKWVQALILEGNIIHDGNPLLDWCISNIMAKEDFKGNVFPRKDTENSQNKIDLAIAMLMAFGRIMYHKQEQQSYYETNEMIIF